MLRGNPVQIIRIYQLYGTAGSRGHLVDYASGDAPRSILALVLVGIALGVVRSRDIANKTLAVPAVTVNYLLVARGAVTVNAASICCCCTDPL